MRFCIPALSVPAAALAAAVAGAMPAKASFIGDEFSASYQVPAIGTVYSSASWSPPTFVVGPGVETLGNIEGVTTIATDFTSSSLELVLNTVLATPTWNSAAFNGPVFAATAPLGITGVSVNPATTMSGFDAGRVSFTANEIRVDWNGLSYVNGTVVRVDFTFIPVPEPSTIALFGMALLGLAVMARRHPET